MRSNDSLPVVRAPGYVDAMLIAALLLSVFGAAWALSVRQPEIDRAAAAQAAEAQAAVLTRDYLTADGDTLGALREVYARSWTQSRFNREVHRLNPTLGQTLTARLKIKLPSDGRLEAIEREVL